MVFIPCWCVDGLHGSSSELLGADQGVPQHRRSLQHGLPGGDHRLAADHEPPDQPQCALTPGGLSLYGCSPCSYPDYLMSSHHASWSTCQAGAQKNVPDVLFLSFLKVVLRWVVNIVYILCVLFSVYELQFCFNIFNKCISHRLCSSTYQIRSSWTISLSCRCLPWS